MITDGNGYPIGLKAQGIDVPPQISEMLPYVATLVALYVYARRTRVARGVTPA